MKHITEEELIAYACGDAPEQAASAITSHLNECPSCRQSVQETKLVLGELEGLPVASAPTFAWSRLEARVEATVSRPVEEVRWLRLTLAHVAGVLLAFALIATAGAWLSSSELWSSLGSQSALRVIGPNGASALCFFAIGAILAVALTPVLWWDARRAARAGVRSR